MRRVRPPSPPGLEQLGNRRVPESILALAADGPASCLSKSMRSENQRRRRVGFVSTQQCRRKRRPRSGTLVDFRPSNGGTHSDLRGRASPELAWVKTISSDKQSHVRFRSNYHDIQVAFRCPAVCAGGTSASGAMSRFSGSRSGLRGWTAARSALGRERIIRSRDRSCDHGAETGEQGKPDCAMVSFLTCRSCMRNKEIRERLVLPLPILI